MNDFDIDFDKVLFSDLHLHSRFSRACSKDITFENLVKWAKIKGINLLGTGDFTHPLWLKEIKENLSEKNGFYYYKDFPFILSGEISLIYTQEHGRRIHLVVLVPNLEIADRINFYLDTKGRRDYDGRPIFNITGEEFVKRMMNISREIEIIPAHIWTPWFGLFGSMSGFDSLKECFKEQTENIHAIETGMSSDPEMNWRIKELEDKAIVSFSDSHSFWPFRMGREATIFKKTDSYLEIIRQIREKTFVGTIETEPAYGKYHWDGHRNCNFSCSTEESEKLNGICPVCKKPLTIGVDNRVEKLATHARGFKIENAKPFYRILPIHEILALALGTSIESKAVWNVYNSLIKEFGNEFEILLKISREEFINKGVDEKITELIIRNRQEKIRVKPGFDGEYGKAMLGERQVTLT
jgi:uncharacterized protein (TIGR00375 family)